MGCVSGSSTFDPEPTATNIFLPSCENASARVQCPAVWQICDVLRSAGRLQVTVVISEAHHLGGVPHIQPLRVRARGSNASPYGCFSPVAKIANSSGFVSGKPAIHADAAGVALGKKDVSVRRRPQRPGVVESRGVQLHLESRGRHRPGIVWSRRHLRTILRRLGCIRRRQVFHPNFVGRARFLVAEVGERRRRGEPSSSERPYLAAARSHSSRRGRDSIDFT